MKKIIFITLFFIGFNSIEAQEAKWYSNFDEAAKLSKKTNKPILANFTGSDWCGWCIRLDKEVFSKKEFQKWADENVILLTVDFPRRKKLPENIKTQNNALQRAFQVRGYPTIWLMNPGNGEVPTDGIVPLGKTSYVKGGAEKWIASIAPSIPSK
jgi:protein disulfide-isomerase